MKIIDAMMFFDEVDMLKFRLRLLSAHVDHFVIAEADKTHSGKERELVFPTIQKNFAWIEPKIVYVPVRVDLAKSAVDFIPDAYTPDSIHWRIEGSHRNALAHGLGNFGGDDIVLISDCDEIPSLEAIHELKHSPAIVREAPVVCRQFFFYYNLRHLREEEWNGTVATTVERARARSPQWHRDQRNRIQGIRPGGWHLSYFGDPNKIRNKLEAFAHQEYNRDRYKDERHISACIASGKDLFGRGTPVRPVGPDFFPPYFRAAMAPFPQFLG